MRTNDIVCKDWMGKMMKQIGDCKTFCIKLTDVAYSNEPGSHCALRLAWLALRVRGVRFALFGRYVVHVWSPLRLRGNLAKVGVNMEELYLRFSTASRGEVTDDNLTALTDDGVPLIMHYKECARAATALLKGKGSKPAASQKP